MEVAATITEDDVAALNEHVLRHSPVLRRQYLIVWLGAPLLFLVAGFPGDLFTEEALAAGFPFVVMAFAWLVIFPVVGRRCRIWNVRRLLRGSRNLGLFGPQRITISAKEIARHFDMGYSVCYWPAIERIEVGPHHVFLFQSALNAFIVPKRAFDNEMEFDLFVATANRYWREALTVAGNTSAQPS